MQHTARRFSTDSARALLAGTAAHSMEPLTAPLTSAFALLLTALGHGAGWPVVAGGSAAITQGLANELRRLGGVVHTDSPGAPRWPSCRRPGPCCSTPRPGRSCALAGARLSRRAGRPWARFKPGAGTCKVDWALDGPVPWSAEACRRTVTVHVGGTFDEVARSEAAVQAGRHAEQPFVLVAQPCVVDPTPGARGQAHAVGLLPRAQRIRRRHDASAWRRRSSASPPASATWCWPAPCARADQAEAHNPNLLGGDVNGGAATLRQTIFRPVARWNPYRTPVEGVYLCSASTPPGGGVHGMCGVLAAEVALRERFG